MPAGGGHPLASLEAVPDGKAVAHHGGQAGGEADDRPPGPTAQGGGRHPFGQVAEQHQRRFLAAHGAQHVGRPRVPAARAVDVDPEQAGDDDAEVHAAQQVAGDDGGDVPGVHAGESRSGAVRRSGPLPAGRRGRYVAPCTGCLARPTCAGRRRRSWSSAPSPGTCAPPPSNSAPSPPGRCRAGEALDASAVAWREVPAGLLARLRPGGRHRGGRPRRRRSPGGGGAPPRGGRAGGLVGADGRRGAERRRRR